MIELERSMVLKNLEDLGISATIEQDFVSVGGGMFYLNLVVLFNNVADMNLYKLTKDPKSRIYEVICKVKPV